MADLISRAATLERMKSMAGCATCDNYNYVRCRACIWDDAMNIVEEMSEVEAVPVVQGRWIDECCSECGQYVYRGDSRNYCPNCGAKMNVEG